MLRTEGTICVDCHKVILIHVLGIISKYLFDFLVQKFLNFDKLFFRQLFLRSFPPFLRHFEESSFLLKVLSSVFREVLCYNELHKVFDVCIAKSKLVDIKANQLTDLGSSEATSLDDVKEGESEHCAPNDHDQASQDVSSENFYDVKEILLSADIGKVCEEDASARIETDNYDQREEGWDSMSLENLEWLVYFELSKYARCSNLGQSTETTDYETYPKLVIDSRC